jgi:hypothetical protein
MEDFQVLITIYTLHNLTLWLVLFTWHLAIHVLFYKDHRSRDSCRKTNTFTINLKAMHRVMLRELGTIPS